MGICLCNNVFQSHLVLRETYAYCRCNRLTGDWHDSNRSRCKCRSVFPSPVMVKIRLPVVVSCLLWNTEHSCTVVLSTWCTSEKKNFRLNPQYISKKLHEDTWYLMQAYVMLPPRIPVAHIRTVRGDGAIQSWHAFNASTGSWKGQCWHTWAEKALLVARKSVLVCWFVQDETFTQLIPLYMT